MEMAPLYHLLCGLFLLLTFQLSVTMTVYK
jgi:hypothetical protein